MAGTSNSGRHNLPTALKALRGTLRKNRMNPDEPESTLVTSEPTPSRKFGKHAMNEWKRVTKVLIDVRVLTEMDISLLESYCYQYGLMMDAQDILGKEGILIKKKIDGHRPHPCLKIQNDAYERMLKVGILFGLAPSGRSRIVSYKDKPVSKMDLI